MIEKECTINIMLAIVFLLIWTLAWFTYGARYEHHKIREFLLKKIKEVEGQ